MKNYRNKKIDSPNLNAKYREKLRAKSFFKLGERIFADETYKHTLTENIQKYFGTKVIKQIIKTNEAKEITDLRYVDFWLHDIYILRPLANAILNT